MKRVDMPGVRHVYESKPCRYVREKNIYIYI